MRIILANRLVLNARAYGNGTNSTQKMSTISFRIIGTLDAPLRSSSYDEEFHSDGPGRQVDQAIDAPEASQLAEVGISTSTTNTI